MYLFSNPNFRLTVRGFRKVRGMTKRCGLTGIMGTVATRRIHTKIKRTKWVVHISIQKKTGGVFQRKGEESKKEI